MFNNLDINYIQNELKQLKSEMPELKLLRSKLIKIGKSEYIKLIRTIQMRSNLHLVFLNKYASYTLVIHQLRKNIVKLNSFDLKTNEDVCNFLNYLLNKCKTKFVDTVLADTDVCRKYMYMEEYNEEELKTFALYLAYTVIVDLFKEIFKRAEIK